MTTAPARHAGTIIFPASLDPKAVSVVERLTEAGFESYLVGGCVRDLLLGHIPKDFDVSTEARPRQIRRVFRNCRVIGRRFKLAHVHFGPKIIEVATFRRNPDDADPGDVDGDDDEHDGESDDLLILRDNVYGTAEQDAIRRDFTINALLYDVGKAEVIDWVGGVEDLERRVLRTIGDAEVRIAEDPVRMLRAIKFTARLGLTLDPELDAAMRRSAAAIERSAPPRVLEEIHKLLTCGKAEVGLGLLLEYGLLARLLPEVAPYWERHRDELAALGRAIDHVDRGQRQMANATLLALLWHDPWRELLESQDDPDPTALIRDLVTPAAMRMSIPRRDVGHMKALLTTQLRLEKARRGRRLRLTEFLGRGAVQDAIDFLYLRCLAGGADPEKHAEWAERLAWLLGEQAPAERADDVEDEPRPRRRRRRRTRGGRRRGEPARGRDGAPAEDADDDEQEPEDRPQREPRGIDDAPQAPAEPTGRPRRAPARRDDDARRPEQSDADPAPLAAEGTAAPESRKAVPPTPTGGLKGLVGRLVRKVLSRDEAQPAAMPPSRSAGTPTAASPPHTPDDQPSAEADGAGDATRHDGEAGAAPDGEAPRRRRRRRGGRKHKRTGEPTTAEGDDGPRPQQDTAAGAASATSSDAKQGERPKRRRRRRGGAARADGSPAGSEARGDGGGRSGKSRSRSGTKPGSKSGASTGSRSGAKSDAKPGGKSGAKRAARKRPDVDREFAPDSGPSVPGSPQHHPEDVEDYFDW